MQGQGNHNDIVEFAVRRNVTVLFKNFLIILEDLRDSNSISPEEYQKKRTRILSYGNDSIRELLETIDKFDFQLKSN